MDRLTGVSETLLVCLYARYLETIRAGGLIKDEKAVEIIQNIDFDFSKFRDMWFTQVSTAIRVDILDQETKAFLKENPTAIVVNLGAGLCTRFFRMDNGKVKWFDLDVEEVKYLWERLIGETDRHKYLACSLLDFSWMDEFKNREKEKFLFIAEGVLIYFTEEEVKKFIVEIAHNFPGSDMLLDALGPLSTKITKLHPVISKTDASFKWGIESLKALEKWSSRIKFVDEHYYLDLHRERWKWMRFFNYVPLLRSEMKAGHLRFK